MLKFIYSEKATKFCEIFTFLLSYVVPIKSKVKILQNFVAFSEYMNFKEEPDIRVYLLLMYYSVSTWLIKSSTRDVESWVDLVSFSRVAFTYR